jgi:hypothetical protein
MTRGYDEFVGRVFDLLSPQTVLLLLIVATGLVAVLWYWFPAWVPRRMPRLPKFRRPRFRIPRVRLSWRLPRWRLPR